jgi:hypothetical protein
MSASAACVPGLTTAQVEASPTDHRPEFVRLPKPGTLCPKTGLSRSYMNSLVLPCEANDGKPPVQSVSLRKRGATKGVRLVSYDSLIAYLNAHVDGGLAQ